LKDKKEKTVTVKNYHDGDDDYDDDSGDASGVQRGVRTVRQPRASTLGGIQGVSFCKTKCS